MVEHIMTRCHNILMTTTNSTDAFHATRTELSSALDYARETYAAVIREIADARGANSESEIAALHASAMRDANNPNWKPFRCEMYPRAVRLARNYIAADQRYWDLMSKAGRVR